MTEDAPATPARASLGTDVPETPPRTATTLQPLTPVVAKTASSQSTLYFNPRRKG